MARLARSHAGAGINRWCKYKEWPITGLGKAIFMWRLVTSWFKRSMWTFRSEASALCCKAPTYNGNR